jgi:hypothetical protein
MLNQIRVDLTEWLGTKETSVSLQRAGMDAT